MQQYLNLLQDVLDNGQYKGDRTGHGTYSVFRRDMRFDLTQGFPLLTTKQVNFRPVVAELLWFLSGSTNINDLDAKIWNHWATDDGELGPIYGEQWTRWSSIDQDTATSRLRALQGLLTGCDEEDGDSHAYSQKAVEQALLALEETLTVPPINQIDWVIDELTQNPDSRRIVVNAWNPSVVPRTQRTEYAHFFDATPEEREGWDPVMLADGTQAGAPDNPRYYRVVSIRPQDNVQAGRAAIPACHTLFQFYTALLTIDERVELAHRRGLGVDLEAYQKTDWDNEQSDRDAANHAAHHFLDSVGIPRRRLSCSLYARSQDICIGTPFNIASYALLTHMLASTLNMEVGELIWSGGDCHIYSGQMDGVREQLARTPNVLPQLKLNPMVKSVYDFTLEDFELVDYNPQSPINFGPIAV